MVRSLETFTAGGSRPLPLKDNSRIEFIVVTEVRLGMHANINKWHFFQFLAVSH
jgi:hypothetical protein